MNLTYRDYQVYVILRKIHCTPSSFLDPRYFGSDQGSQAECSYCEYYNRDSSYDDSDAVWMPVRGFWGCGHKRTTDVYFITSKECSTIRPMHGPSFRMKADDVIRWPLDKFYTPVDPDCLVSWYYVIDVKTDQGNEQKHYIIEVYYDDQTYVLHGSCGMANIHIESAFNKRRQALIVRCIEGNKVCLSISAVTRVSCEKP